MEQCIQYKTGRSRAGGGLFCVPNPRLEPPLLKWYFSATATSATSSKSTVLGSVFEQQVAGERRVVVEQRRVLIQLDPDVVVASQRQHDGLAASAVARSAVAVNRCPMPVVHHDPGEHVAAVLAEHVRREQIGSVQLADEVRRIHVERVSHVGENHVEGDRRVLQHWAELLTARHREGDPGGGRPASRLALLTLEAGEAREAAVTLLTLVARRTCRTRVALSSVASSTALLAGRADWTHRTRKTYTQIIISKN